MRAFFVLSLIVFLGMAGWNLAEKFFAYYLDGSPLFVSPYHISLVVVVIYAFLAFSTLFAGIAIERHGSRKCMSLGILVYSPFIFILAFYPCIPGAYTLLLLSAAFVGIGGGFFWTGTWAYLLKTTREHGEATGNLQGISLIAASLIALFGGLALLAWPMESLFFVGGFLVLASALLALLLKEERPSARVSWAEQSRLFRDRRLLSLGAVQFVSSTFTGLTLSLLPLVVNELPLFIDTPAGKGLEVGLVIAILYFLGALMSISIGKMSDVRGRKLFFYLILLTGSISSLMIAASTGMWMVFLGILVYGPFLWLAIILMVASVGDLFKEKQALALVVTGFIGTLGVATGGLIAAVGSLESLRLPFVVVAVLFLASTLLVKKLPLS